MHSHDPILSHFSIPLSRVPVAPHRRPAAPHRRPVLSCRRSPVRRPLHARSSLGTVRTRGGQVAPSGCTTTTAARSLRDSLGRASLIRPALPRCVVHVTNRGRRCRTGRRVAQCTDGLLRIASRPAQAPGSGDEPRRCRSLAGYCVAWERASPFPAAIIKARCSAWGAQLGEPRGGRSGCARGFDGSAVSCHGCRPAFIGHARRRRFATWPPPALAGRRCLARFARGQRLRPPRMAMPGHRRAPALRMPRPALTLTATGGDERRGCQMAPGADPRLNRLTAPCPFVNLK